ncbi:MAG: histone deacetylase [Fimbriimonadaceae bacterium]|nr:histone deacetylase [Fimbriimonadaceae bacterium]
MASGLVTSTTYLNHDTGPFHPEQPRRLRAIVAAMGEYPALCDLLLLEPRAATRAEVERVHDPLYVDDVAELAAAGGGALDVDTPVSAASYEVALLSAGGALTAVEAVLAGKVSNAFVASRPPGHHARPGRGMGFCLFNNIAVAARHARSLGCERVAILDWDVHHGNGTQDAFYSDPSVFFCSMHQAPWYPFTGDADERGAGAGEGTTLNLPLRAGRRTQEYLDLLDETVAPAIAGFQPDLLLVSAGMDIHERDPLGEMRVSAEGFRQMTLRAAEWATELCAGRLVVCLEGGYDLTALAEGSVHILHGLLGLPVAAAGGTSETTP